MIQRPIQLFHNRPVYIVNGLSLICLTLKQEWPSVIELMSDCFKCFKNGAHTKYEDASLALY